MRLNELLQLLKTASCFEEINQHKDEIIELIPSANKMIDFSQQNQAHQYDLWEHCIQTVIGLPKDIEDEMIYLAAILENRIVRHMIQKTAR